MKKILFLMISMLVLALVFTGCGDIVNITAPDTSQEEIAYLSKGTAEDPDSFPLYAGQTELVGFVLVWNDTHNLYVKYVLDEDVSEEGWGITETHLAVGFSKDDFPLNKPGNPKIGLFPYGEDDLEGAAEAGPYIIPLEGFEPYYCDQEFTIAAHAVVKKLGGIEGLELTLPEQVILEVISPGDNSYFDVTVSGGTSLDGLYDGWCIDAESDINGTPYLTNVYSSYDEGLPVCLVDFPQNLDLVNYIVNQSYVGETSPCGGMYTIGDVQRAIWLLLDDNPDAGHGEGPWTQCHIDEILADAYANGEGYEPVCGEKAAVILAPLPECEIQSLIIVVDVPCEGDETAWAAQDDPGNYLINNKKGNWATYFTYILEGLCMIL